MSHCPYKEYCKQECKVEKPTECEYWHLYADVGHNLKLINNDNGIERVVLEFER